MQRHHVLSGVDHIAAADSHNDCKLTIADVLVTLQTILN